MLLTLHYHERQRQRQRSGKCSESFDALARRVHCIFSVFSHPSCASVPLSLDAQFNLSLIRARTHGHVFSLQRWRAGYQSKETHRKFALTLPQRPASATWTIYRVFQNIKKKGKKWAFFCHYQNLSRYLTKCSIKRSSSFVSYWFRKKNWSYFLTLINVSRAKHKLLRAYRFSIPRYFCTEFAIGRWSYRTNAVPMRFSRSGNSCVIIPIINVDIETRQIMAR